MRFSQLIKPDNIAIDRISQSKTAVLHSICKLLCKDSPELDTEELFEAYWTRENLGSTAIGHGIIVPHVRVSALAIPKACFIKLSHPVDFGAEDKQPADLVIGLASPQNQSQQHLMILKTVIEKFGNADFRKCCRQLDDTTALYTLLTKEQVPAECA